MEIKQILHLLKNGTININDAEKLIETVQTKKQNALSVLQNNIKFEFSPYLQETIAAAKAFKFDETWSTLGGLNEDSVHKNLLSLINSALESLYKQIYFVAPNDSERWYTTVESGLFHIEAYMDDELKYINLEIKLIFNTACYSLHIDELKNIVQCIRDERDNNIY